MAISRPYVRSSGSSLSAFFHLSEIQFDRSRTPKNRHRNLQRAAIGVDLFHLTGEIGEWAIHDAHLFVTFEHQLGLGLLRRSGHAVENALHLLLTKRRGRLPRTNTARDPRRRAHHMPAAVVHFHFPPHVTGL